MGNFSRDTFHPEKNYVGVRLQQGVPLVDADWNELNDVIRQDFYNGLGAVHPDGVTRLGASQAAFAFTIFPAGTANDLLFIGGTTVVDGRPVRLPVYSSSGSSQKWTYTGQPWTDEMEAARIGVDVIPQLTTPSADRRDVVYLDVWEREVGQAEDPEITNSVIGVETAVRLKREVAVRVREGMTSLPVPPSGHSFMPLAILNRAGGNPLIYAAHIQDIRAFINTSPAIRFLSLTPVFQALIDPTTGPDNALHSWSMMVEWHAITQAPRPYASASLASSGGRTVGMLPVNLPLGARLASIWFRGSQSGSRALRVSLFRALTGSGVVVDTIADETVTATGDFFRMVAATPLYPSLQIVDNVNYTYYLMADVTGAGTTIINSMQVVYSY